MDTKLYFREKFKTLIRDTGLQQAPQRSQIEFQFLTQLKEFFHNKKGYWGAFFPMPSEPQILDHLRTLDQIQWTFPKAEGSILTFHEDIHFEQNAMGYHQPVSQISIPLNNIEGFLIPGLAFQPSGFRLGRGKGFYDRTLAKTPGTRVGVCFDFQIQEEIGPVENHDLKMDFILTNHRTFRC